MKKSKRSRSKTLDRLSELPDSLIFSIFELLPMRTLVGTTILSKRWRNLWTTAPCLNFVDHGERPEYFITRALMFWRGTKIVKFKIKLRLDVDDHKIKTIDSWVRFAKDFGVEELYLHLSGCSDVDGDDKDYPTPEYPVPQYLFSSCPSLKLLSLKGCKVHIDRNVQWNQLKSLTIRSENGLRCDDIVRVLHGSPQLEVLVLRFYETREHLTIRSSSLKKLSIDKFIGAYDKTPPPMNTCLIICTPNLETLEISNVPYFFCSLDDVSSLTDVSLLFHDCNYVDLIIGLFEAALKQIHPTIQHVENVTLSNWCIMALAELKRKHLVPGVWDVKFLKLDAYFSNHKDIVCALEIFSKVEMLVLEDMWEANLGMANSYMEFQPSLPNLKCVEVIWRQSDYTIFTLMDILLKYASSLENMVFRVKGAGTGFSQSHLDDLASDNLQRMQRSFPGKLIFV